MGWLARPTVGAPPGILPHRQAAEAGLLRVISRARQQQSKLVLLRVEPGADLGALAGPAPETAWQQFLGGLAAEVRINDLAWREPGGVVMVLLENATGEAALERLERRALVAGARPRWRAAQFPQQGLTLQALLDTVNAAAMGAQARP